MLSEDAEEKGVLPVERKSLGMSDPVLISYKPRMLYCPLCGGTPKLMRKNRSQEKSSKNLRYWIVCEDCKAETKEWSSLPNLLAYWNTREEERCQTVFI